MIDEKDIELYLKKEVEKRNGLCLKWVSPGNAGVPDRIVITMAYTCFVELKRPGEKPRPLQQAWIHKLRDRHRKVYVLDSKEAVDQFIFEAFPHA